jgi:hypothetical protein
MENTYEIVNKNVPPLEKMSKKNLRLSPEMEMK